MEETPLQFEARARRLNRLPLVGDPGPDLAFDLAARPDPNGSLPERIAHLVVTQREAAIEAQRSVEYAPKNVEHATCWRLSGQLRITNAFAALISNGKNTVNDRPGDRQ